ncbi:MAG: hypothetical protein MZU95_13235 [Desulfomicrobium escambiense]|nr:hypothetical protein [Desulfomicrobium escambiense]
MNIIGCPCRWSGRRSSRSRRRLPATMIVAFLELAADDLGRFVGQLVRRLLVA